jgi:hypothetical protein
MMEDFWMPRREGGKGTEITTLAGGQNLGQIEDIEYFKEKLLRSLNVPIGRMKPDQTFNIGRSNEITRDELKFMKFVKRLRSKFNQLFMDLLKVQLVSKGVIRHEEWQDISGKINLEYLRDNQFTEMKEAEILNSRVAILQQVDMFVGKYYSKNWVRKNVLRLSDEEIEEIDNEIEEEAPAAEEEAAAAMAPPPQQGDKNE